MKTSLLPLVQKSLEVAGIAYKVVECDPELADTAAFCERYGFSLDQSANTIIVQAKTEPRSYAACVVLASTRLDVNQTVRALMATKKVSFAPMDEALRLTGMDYGGVTIFGLPMDIPIYIDAGVLAPNEVILGGGNRFSKVLLAPAELLKLPGVQVVDGLAKQAIT
ncbi:MAG: YbaK/EbsC family protein [Candidatus Saccharimonadales bacterium]